MTTKDYTIYSAQEIMSLVLEMTPDELRQVIGSFTLPQLSAIVTILHYEQDPAWSDKLMVLYQELSSKEQLEAAGKTLNFIQMLELLEITTRCAPALTWKLSPLFVGLPHETFQQMIISALTPHLEVLRHEAINESIQHHVTLFVHDLLNGMEQQIHLLKTLSDEILALETSQMGPLELKQVQQRLDEASQTFEQFLEKINKLLTLAWNSNRIDLVAKLSTLKEVGLKILRQQIGSPRDHESPATGLYAQLEEHLNLIYSDPFHRNSVESLEDDEPAIEALTKFSLWYLKDYWEIGLLPGIKDLSSLDLESKGYSEKDYQEERTKLLEQIHANLQRLCLSTVGDLKAANIYSKELLRNYIEQNSHLLV